MVDGYLTKDEIKTLCEKDDKLQWWAMVLFAEVTELVHALEHGRDVDFSNGPASLLRYKVKEFEKLVIQVALEKAKE